MMRHRGAAAGRRLAAVCRDVAAEPEPEAFELQVGGGVLSSATGQLGLLRPSNDVLHDDAALRARLEQDGYVYIRQLVPADTTDNAYGAARRVLQEENMWPWGKFSTEW